MKILLKHVLKIIAQFLLMLLPIKKHRLKKENNIKILLVKQTVYQDLYCCLLGTSPKEVIYSSLKRTGPVGLFLKLNSDFLILDTVDDQECQIWKQKVTNCNLMTFSFFRDVENKPYLNGLRGHRHGQKYFSTSPDMVKWDDYDIVISYDIAVPSRITKMHPQVVWCYYISEPCMPAYASSHETPIEGYDLFLNQHFSKFKLSKSKHEIDFPYFIHYSGCFHDLLNTNEDLSKKEGLFLESHTETYLTTNQKDCLMKLGTCRRPSGSTENIINGLINSKYFVSFGGRRLWGNAMIEAIAAGCLVIGNPFDYKHISLFTSRTAVYSFNSLIKRIQYFEKHPTQYLRELSKQRTLLNELCFNRPMRKLMEKSEAIAKTKSN